MNRALRTSCLLAAVFASSATAFAHEGDPKLLQRQPMYPGTGWRNAQLQQAGGSGPMLLQGPSFPKSGVTLLAWLSLPDFGVPSGGNGNSCFGYTAPSGREYAIMGLSTGTAFVEITQPGNPVIVAQVAGPQSLWRDIRVFQDRCYAVSEGGSGIQVMNLANIDGGVVTLVNTINDDATAATHTIAMDTASGFLYRSGGGSNGLRIYDVGANPTNPPRVGTWSARYVHEPSIFTFTSGPAAGKQIAYCCGGLNGGFNSTGLYVVDVTNKAAPVQTAFVTYPNAQYAHQCWPSPDMQWLYLDDELDDQNLGLNSQIRVFSLANPLVPTYVGTFTNGETSTDHNLYTKNDLIYQAAYRTGMRIYKTSAPGTPQVPVEVAYFDTWPDDDLNDFNGLWNIYPYFPSGVVIGSDIERGLFIWWVGAPLLDFTIVGGAPALVSPAGRTLDVQVTGTPTPGTELIHVDTGSGFVSAPMTALGGGLYRAQLPATSCGTTVRWYFSGQSSNGIVWVDPEGAPDAAPYTAVAGFGQTTAVNDAFEAASGWTAGAAGDNATSGAWVRADPIGTSSGSPVVTQVQPEDDHTAAPGTQCWFTGQGAAGGATGAADVDGGRTTLVSPAFNLSSLSAAKVGYWRWYSNSSGAAPGADTFRVDVSNDNGANWVNAETVGPATENAGGWIHHEFTVASFVTPTATVRVRFVAEDIGSGSVVEAAIDDFQVTSTDCAGFGAFCAGDGTALPCPCGNDGAAGAGCANSTFASGALLSASGTARVSADTVALSAASMTGSTCVFFQGTAEQPPVIVDDGIGCVTGTVIRLGTKPVSANASSFPQAGDPLISVRGAVPAAGATRYYQCFYRNAVSAFCPPATSNRTNGVAVFWAP